MFGYKKTYRRGARSRCGIEGFADVDLNVIRESRRETIHFLLQDASAGCSRRRRCLSLHDCRHHHTVSEEKTCRGGDDPHCPHHLLLGAGGVRNRKMTPLCLHAHSRTHTHTTTHHTPPQGYCSHTQTVAGRDGGRNEARSDKLNCGTRFRAQEWTRQVEEQYGKRVCTRTSHVQNSNLNSILETFHCT